MALIIAGLTIFMPKEQAEWFLQIYMKATRNRRSLKAQPLPRLSFETWQGIKIAIKFVLFGLSFMLLAVVQNPVSGALASRIIVSTTIVSAWFMRLVGLSVEAKTAGDGLIMLPQQTLAINLECSAISIMILFSAFIVSYPSDFRSKLVGLAVGIPLIFAVNIIRLVVMAVTAANLPDIFGYIHDYVWQSLFIVFIILLWLIWIEKVIKREGQAVLSN